MRRGETVILAAGDFPRKGGEAWMLLSSARRIVACDSAADSCRRRLGRWPEVVIGDLDSLKALPRGACVVRVADQDTNDLEKAMSYCESRGWRSPVVVGATGRREDHAIGNVFRALEHRVEVVTDFGRFVPLCGKKTFVVRKGSAVSVFAPDAETRMTSRGLEWPLDGVRFASLYCATLNRASASRVTLSADRPVSVYLEAVPQIRTQPLRRESRVC